MSTHKRETSIDFILHIVCVYFEDNATESMIKRKAVQCTKNQVYKSISHSGESGNEFCQQYSRFVSVGDNASTKREYSGKKWTADWNGGKRKPRRPLE